MSIGRGEQPRWGPVDRQGTGGSVPRQEGRTSVRLRSQEEQAAYRARTEAAQREAKREAVKDVAEKTVDQQWEDRRQELVALGGIFDEKGNITQAGQNFLTGESGWSIQQVLQMEALQKNHVAPVEVIRPGKDEGAPEGRMSSMERGRMAAHARARAEQELANRARLSLSRRAREGERKLVGVRARANAILNGASEAMADRLGKEAEDAYDRKIQREQDLRTA